MKEIVIKIRDDIYKGIMDKHPIPNDIEIYTQRGELVNAVRKGRLLPKGHGELRDTTTIVDKLTDTDVYLTDKDWNEIGKALRSAEVLVEADKEGKK